jgi:hypothetical protein
VSGEKVVSIKRTLSIMAVIPRYANFARNDDVFWCSDRRLQELKKPHPRGALQRPTFTTPYLVIPNRAAHFWRMGVRDLLCAFTPLPLCRGFNVG